MQIIPTIFYLKMNYNLRNPLFIIGFLLQKTHHSSSGFVYMTERELRASDVLIRQQCRISTRHLLRLCKGWSRAESDMVNIHLSQCDDLVLTNNINTLLTQ